MHRVLRLNRVVIHVARRCNSAAATFVPKTIETIPVRLHKYLFGSEAPPTASTDHFTQLELPELSGSLPEHFRKLAEEKVSTYRSYIDSAAKWDSNKYRKTIRKEFAYRTGWTRYDHETGEETIVSHPLEQCMVFDVEVCVSDALPKGKLPTMATALTDKAWYSWCSSRLVNDTSYPTFATTDQLIPLTGSEKSLLEPRLVIGHNVGYDRARCMEPYLKEKSGLRYLDTMSMAIPMYGMADHMQSLYSTTDVDDEVERPGAKKFYRKKDVGAEKERLQAVEAWQSSVTRVGLLPLYEFLFGYEAAKGVLSKTTRDTFVDQPIEYFRDPEVFQDSMRYCARDVSATTEVFQKMLVQFDEMFPHPATLYGMLSMGAAYLPINQYWPMFYEKNEKELLQMKQQAVRNIVKCAREVESAHNENDPDLWMWSDNWATNKKGNTEWLIGLFKKKSGLDIDIEELEIDDVVGKSKLIPRIFGMIYGPYPLFYHETYGWGYLVPRDDDSKASQTVNFKRAPIKRILPMRKLRDAVDDFKLEYGEIILDPDMKKEKIGNCDYYQLQSDSKSVAVGTPFAKIFRKDLEMKVLRSTRFEAEFESFLNVQRVTDFWTMYSERYGEEMHVWYPDDCSTDLQTLDNQKLVTEKPKMLGAMAPAIVPAGTVSRRSVHKLWVTMTNAKDSARLGTHLKSMVQSPTGKCLVGADVDSQEQWLAALFGDASDAWGRDESERRAGRTPFSNMMLAGQKSDGSDLHTVVARDLGINRDQAKTLNYARLYGSGRMHAETFLRKTGTKDSEAAAKASRLFEITKGKELSYRKLTLDATPFFEMFCKEQNIDDGFLRVNGQFYLPEYTHLEGKLAYDFEEWLCSEVEKRSGNKVKRERLIPMIYQKYEKTQKLYNGGFESSTFNFLVLSSRNRDLRTPILGCKLGAGLRVPELDDDFGVTERGVSMMDQQFKRSVMNWVVQSSAVDFLHLLLLSMDWLCEKYKIDARFVISIHDEVRFLCSEEDSPRCALALMLSNMYVRAAISQTLGIPQLPMNVAFFSQVDKDCVLRKEVNTPCENPDGTHPENGIAWDMAAVMQLTGGKLSR